MNSLLRCIPEKRKHGRFLLLVCISLISSVNLVAQFSGGAGTQADPYLVHNQSDLDNVRNYPASYFLQALPITLGSAILPIDNFTGTYDGGDNTISNFVNMVIDDPSMDNCGLFRTVKTGGVVKNVHLRNVDIFGQNWVGALVGYLDGGSILHCSSSGSVGANGSMLGGLIGQATPGSKVANCYSTARVWCSFNVRNDAGGLVGVNNGSIDSCYATGIVDGLSDFFNAGGFVGKNSGTINNCYSTTTVGGGWGAGFCGRMENGTINACYAMGYLKSVNVSSGFCSNIIAGSITNSFWNIQTSGCFTSTGGTGISDSVLRVQSYLEAAGWNFSTGTAHWVINSGYNNGYPALNGLTPSSPFAVRAKAVTALRTTSVIIHGTVTSNAGGSSSVYILYGRDFGTYTDSVLAAESPISGASETSVSAQLTGLLKGVTYFYAVAASVGANYSRSAAWQCKTTTAFSGGTGTANDPYLIGTAADLEGMGYAPYKGENAYFIQIADITVSSMLNPIDFSGSYDGQGFSIKNLYLNYSIDALGLFIHVLIGRTVKNVHLVDAYIRGWTGVGGIASYNGGTISKCSVTGSIISQLDGSLGGFVSFNAGVIDQCYSLASVTCEKRSVSAPGSDIGGFTGRNDGTITNCFAGGNVGNEMCKKMGGFVAVNFGTINNCYSYGHVSAAYNYGGFCYEVDAGAVTNCFWDTTTSGCKTSDAGTGLSTADMRKALTYTDAGWNFSSVWWISTVVNNGYPQLQSVYGSDLCKPAGAGTELSPYQITTLANLYWISQNSSSWTGHCIQLTDIDASISTELDGGAGFTPIGTGANYFSGSYNGQNHIIKGLYINRPSLSGVGLFGYRNGPIKNLGVQDANITGSSGTGALVGISYGDTVSQCWSSGKVKSSSTAIGGLMGECSGTTVVINSYSRCSVAGGSSVGGLTSGGTVVNCYSTGPVSGTLFVGGLCYYGTAANSFWDMQTSGITNGAGTGKLTIEMMTQNLFTAAGWDFAGETANGTDDIWGIFGSVNDGYPCFAWQLPSGFASTASGVNLLKKGTSVTVDITVPGAWSVSSDQSWLTVTPASGTGNATLSFAADTLRSITKRTALVTLTASGTTYRLDTVVQIPTNTLGTLADPHPIGTYDDLKQIGSLFDLFSCLRQTADIDAAASATENSGSGFVPIGSTATPFNGVYHGGGFLISNLHINRPSADTIGLFGILGASAQIDSVQLRNVLVNGKSVVGGLAGGYNGTIRSCSVTGSISGTDQNTGGLLGYAFNSSSIVDDCFSAASVSGHSSVGGLIGTGDGLITNSYATGPVTTTGSGNSTGGFMGTAYAMIQRCYASGAVSGYSEAGGFVGALNGSAENCYAAGSVKGTGNYIGGFCGQGNSTITNCYALGSASGAAYIGGLIGYLHSGAVTSSYWNSNVTSLSLYGRRTSGTCADTSKLTPVQLRKSATYAGWNFTSIWTIREDSTYPGLRSLANNAPSAFPDTLQVSGSVSLAAIINNDFDLENKHTGLFYKVLSVYNAGTVNGSNVFTPADEAKDSLLYRVGKQIATGDTIWSGAAKVILNNLNYISITGAGTIASPYLVSSYAHLKEIRSHLSSVYRLTTNINATPSATENAGAGFVSIGTDSTSSFTGTFHGGGHTIAHLSIYRPMEDYVGLFGYLGTGGSIDSLGLTDAAIIGSGAVGCLVGESHGAIDHCSSTGTVSGDFYIGGLVGLVSDGQINRSFSTATVSGGMIVGGLVGYGAGPIAYSYASGSISATTQSVGGLIGINDKGCSLSNCYSTGSVSAAGATSVGGLAGGSADAIAYCYASGSITGTSEVGGLVGYAACVINSSYWKREHCAVGIGTDAGGSTCTDTAGLTAAQMKLQGSYVGWDFASTWEIVTGYTPRLRENRDAALPVQLSSFTATALSNSATLSWNTATEVNNYGFEVERRTVNESMSRGVDKQKQVLNGSPAQWLKVGFVQGNGTSNSQHKYSFTDAKLAAGTYAYHLKQIDNGGVFKYSQETEITIAVPNVFALSQNYPNPFNPTTTIQYDIPVAGAQKLVTLKVYDIMGREVATLVNEQKEPGSYEVKFDASKFASGIYFYRLSVGNYSAVKKLTFLK